MSRNDPQFNLRIPKDTLRSLQAIADVRDKSVTAIVNDAVSKFVESAGHELRLQIMQVRLPVELHAHMKRAAKESGRSLNAEIVYRLQRSIESEATQ